MPTRVAERARDFRAALRNVRTIPAVVGAVRDRPWCPCDGGGRAESLGLQRRRLEGVCHAAFQRAAGPTAGAWTGGPGERRRGERRQRV